MRVVALIVTFVVWMVSGLIGGCGPSQEAKEAAADSAYLAEHLRCVEQFDTRAEIDACREAVRIRWSVHQSPLRYRDSGAKE
jgi:hypothetical protein